MGLMSYRNTDILAEKTRNLKLSAIRREETNIKIYTSNGYADDLVKMKELELGIMIATARGNFHATKEYRDFDCALDNGGFGCARQGYPFQTKLFMDNIDRCFKLGIKLDFIVTPDIMAGGMKSFEYSLKHWVEGELYSAPRLAVVVQDGIKPRMIMHDIEPFTHIFIGGSVEWKWNTAKEWVDFAHDNDKKCHIGQCGQLKYLELAKEYGADSVDSASFVRHKSWHIIEEFMGR